MNSDLKWLAENVPDEMLGKCSKVLRCNNIQGFVNVSISSDGGYTIDEILSARAEMSGKPSWSDIDGEWVFQDCQGWWHSFDETEKPYMQCVEITYGKACNYVTKKGFNKTYGRGKVLGDWRNTLERRPCVSKSAESDKQEDLSVVDGKQWRGPEDGLPPVGTVCEVLHLGDWKETKIIGTDDGLPVFKTEWHDKYAYACGSDFEFRPLRTEEDKAVVEMLALDCEPHEGMLSRENFCRKLYRENYRKQEAK